MKFYFRLKFDFLKKKKSFGSEIKKHGIISQVLSFRLKKQTNKNVADSSLKLKIELKIQHSLIS